MDKVRYGIIGLGNMGTGHIGNFINGEIPNAEVVAICDIKIDRIERIKEKFKDANFVSFLDYKDLIDANIVDAIIVAVPHYFHAEICIYGLEKGVNVICEKPAGVYTKQVKEMIEVANNSKGLFTMMFNQRTNCVYRKARELILQGKIGEIRRVNWIITDWLRSQKYYDSGDWRATWAGEGGGVLFNQCPHQLDLLSCVTNMMPSAVMSHCHFGKWHDIEVEDDVTAYLEYPNGATGVFIASTGDYPGTNRFEITGTKAKLVLTNDTITIDEIEGDDLVNVIKTGTPFPCPKHNERVVETDGENLQHIGICRNFTNAILGKEKLFVDGREGINGVELMDSMILSTWLDKKVNIPIDDDLYYNELQKRIKNSRRKTNVVDIVCDTENSYGSKIRK